MLRQLDEAILVFGPDNRLQIAGEPAERMLARSRDSLIGQPASAVFPDWTHAGAVLARAARTRTTVHEEPVQFERANLPPIRLLMTVEPVDYGDEAGYGMLVALRDADTRTRLRADLDNARRLAAISRITSGVAHEIKNPLNGMMLHLQIAQDKTARAEEVHPELNIIGTELLRLDRVVKALLDFHRPLEPRLAEYDLRELAGEVAAFLRPQAEAQGIRVVLENQLDEPATVICDADLLKQGLMNMGFNALEAMGYNGGLLRFIVAGSGNEYSVSVEDNGPGIPADIQDRIFNLYFTTKKSAGIGLAMTYRIVLLHSGSLTVDSEVGKGTCFRLGLPSPENRTHFSTGMPAPV
jgi:signal transduction histidine kinase